MECKNCGESYPDGSKCIYCRILDDPYRLEITDISTKKIVCPIMTAGRNGPYVFCIEDQCGLWNHDGERCSYATIPGDLMALSQRLKHLDMTIESLIENIVRTVTG